MTDNNTSAFLNQPHLPKLTKTDADKCEGLLTEHDALTTLQNMKLNKSPGCDGLTVKFYLAFWEVIKENLLDSLNQGVIQGELSASQRKGVITLIEKQGKD